MTASGIPSPLTVELFERSAVVEELAPAQIDAWCSGLWSAWESDDEVSEFIRYCDDQGGATAALVARSLSSLAGGELAGQAAEVAERHAGSLPESLVVVPVVGPAEAWQVVGPSSRSIVIGCGVDGASDHALLIELDEHGELIDLELGGDPRELVYGVERPSDDDSQTEEDETGLEGLKVESLSLDDAVAQVVEVWSHAASAFREWPSSVRANEHLVRQRLGESLSALQHERLDIDPYRGMSADDFAEANRAALSTLQSALGKSIDELQAVADLDPATSAAWVAVISGDVRGLPIEEQHAVLFLEWADWLGAGIGMARGGPGTPVDGQALVDMVNRCPEVSTTIDKRDRDYVAFAFDVALELIADAGGVETGKLTPRGHAALAPAMVAAWSR